MGGVSKFKKLKIEDLLSVWDQVKEKVVSVTAPVPAVAAVAPVPVVPGRRVVKESVLRAENMANFALLSCEMQYRLLNINTRKLPRIVADADWEGEEEDRIEVAPNNGNPDDEDNDDEGGGGGDDDDDGDGDDGMQQYGRWKGLIWDSGTGELGNCQVVTEAKLN